MRAPFERIVQTDHIAFKNIREPKVLDDRLGREFHRRQMHWTVGGLTQQLAIVVVDRV